MSRAGFARGCVRIALFGLLLLELAYLSRGLWLERLVRPRLVAALERALGGRLVIGAIHEQGLRHVRCTGIEYQGPGPLRAIRGGELELWVEPRRILDGDLSVLRAASVRAAAVELDLDAAGGSPSSGGGGATDPQALADLLLPLVQDGAGVFVERLVLRGHGQVLQGTVEAAVPRRASPRAPVQVALSAPGLTATVRWEPGAELTAEVESVQVAAWLAVLGVRIPPEVAPGPVRATLVAGAGRARATVHGQATLPVLHGVGGPCVVEAEAVGDAAGIRTGRLIAEAAAWRVQGEVALRIGLGELLADPSRALHAPLAVELAVARGELDRLDPAALGLPRATGSVTGQVRVTGTLAAPEPHGELVLDLPRIPVAGGAEVSVAGRLRAEPRAVQAEDFVVRAAQQELRFDATWKSPSPWWQAPLLGELELRARSADGAALYGAGVLDLQGLRRGEFAVLAPGLRVLGQGIELPWRLAVADADSRMPGMWAAWLAHAQGTLALELRSMAELRSWPHAQFLPGAGRLPDDLSLGLHAALGQGWLQLLRLEARGAGMELQAAPSSVPLVGGDSGQVALWLTVHETPRLAWLPPWLPLPRAGTVALDLRASARHLEGAVGIDLHVRDSTRSGRLHGRVALEAGDTFALRPDLTLTGAAPEATGTVTASGALLGEEGLRLSAVDFTVTAQGIVAGVTPLRVAAALHGDRQRLEGRLDATQGLVHAEGRVELLGGSARNLTAPGVLCAAPLAGTVRFSDLDLATVDFRAFGLGDLSGRATGEIELAGTLDQPSPCLRAQVSGGALRALGAPRLEQLEAEVVATPARLQITRLTATSGLGPLSVRGELVPATTFLDGLTRGRVDLSIDGTDVLLYRRGGLKVRADLKLRAHGPLDAVVVDGRVDVHSARYVARIPLWDPSKQGGGGFEGLVLEGPQLPPGVRVRLDLTVATREPFRVDTNVLKTGISGALALGGTLEAPVLRGDLTAGDGTLALPGVTFTLQSLLVHLDRDRTRAPTVTLRAQGRRHGHEVTLLVTGPVDVPEIVLSSSPPLTAEQLALLVTTGAAPTATDKDRLVGAGTTVGGYLVEEIADSLFGSESTEAKESFLARLKVETGTEVSRSGSESIQVEFRMFGRVYLQGERDVFDDMNIGIVYRVKFK